MPLISVIVPNYCYAQFLEQRLETIFNQSFQDFEVIILDDASPDNGASKSIIERYRENPHVSHIIYNKENSGSPFRQWEKGLNLAAGDWIWIAESDDFCEADFLRRMAAYLDEETALVFCTSQKVDYLGNKLDPVFEPSDAAVYYSGKEFIRNEMLYGNAVWNASSAVFSRKKALEVNKNYIDYRSVGDQLFWIYIAEQGKVIHCLAPLNYFRRHEQSVSPTAIKNGIAAHESYQILRYLEKKGYVPFLERFRIRNCKLQQFHDTSFVDESIRSELMSLWSMHGLMNTSFYRCGRAFLRKLKLFL